MVQMQLARGPVDDEVLAEQAAVPGEVAVDVHQAVQPDDEPALFAGLAQRGHLDGLAAIDVAAGEDPLPVSGFDGALDQHDLAAAADANDRADGNLRIEIEHEPARIIRAYEPFRLRNLQHARLERAAAHGAELIRRRLVV